MPKQYKGSFLANQVPKIPTKVPVIYENIIITPFDIISLDGYVSSTEKLYDIGIIGTLKNPKSTIFGRR